MFNSLSCFDGVLSGSGGQARIEPEPSAVGGDGCGDVLGDVWRAHEYQAAIVSKDPEDGADNPRGVVAITKPLADGLGGPVEPFEGAGLVPLERRRRGVFAVLDSLLGPLLNGGGLELGRKLRERASQSSSQSERPSDRPPNTVNNCSRG